MITRACPTCRSGGRCGLRLYIGTANQPCGDAWHDSQDEPQRRDDAALRVEIGHTGDDGETCVRVYRHGVYRRALWVPADVLAALRAPRAISEREGCCRAAVDSDGHAHDHGEWKRERDEARTERDQAIQTRVSVATTLMDLRKQMAVWVTMRREAEVARDEARAERDSWRRVCERLEGEKVAALAERDETKARLEQVLDQAKVSLDLIDAKNTRLDAWRPVVEAAKAWVARSRQPGSSPANLWADDEDLALLAAVDQLTQAPDGHRHRYLSTSCEHAIRDGRDELHKECGKNQAARGEDGPPHCKYCDAVCACPTCNHAAVDGSTATVWRCQRCGSNRWVAASLTGPVGYGGKAIKQCVPCGHYSNDPVEQRKDVPDA